MPQISFDDIAPAAKPAVKSNALSFDDIAPAPTVLKEKSRAQVDLTGMKIEGSPIDATLALLEQPGALTWQLGGAIVGAWKGMAAAGLSRIPGVGEFLTEKTGDPEKEKRYRELATLPIGDAFMAEFNRVAENASKMYVPISESGAKLTETIAHVFHSAIKFVGEDFFEKGVPIPLPFPIPLRVGAGTPAAGTIGETGVAAALMLLAPGKGKGKGVKPGETPTLPPPTFQETWASFQKKYPATAERFDTSGVGQIRMSDFRRGDRDVFDVVGRNLDTELSLPDNMKKMTLEGKLRLMMSRDAEGVPAGEIDKAVRATIEGLRQLDDVRLAAANERGLPLIPDPAISKEPVIVTKSGTVITAEQAAAADNAFLGMTVEERANALGLSAMGRLRLKMEDTQRARVEGDTRTANRLDNELKREWAQNFPYRDSEKRADGLEQFKNFGGRMTYEELNAQMGVPTRDLGTTAEKPQPKVWKKGKGPFAQPWEPTGLGKSQAGYINPELTTEGVAQLRGRVGDARTLRMFTGTFHKEEIAQAIRDVHNPKSRATIMWMSPDEFLKLAPIRTTQMLESPTAAGRYRSIEKGLETKEGLDDIPLLKISQVGDTLLVTGHEGRHRMDVFKGRGLDQIPVRVMHETRQWGKAADRGEGLPSKIKSQGEHTKLSTESFSASGWNALGKGQGGAQDRGFPREAKILGDKQRGLITIEGLSLPDEPARRAATGAASRPWSVGREDVERVAYEQVQAAYNKSRVAEELAIKSTLGDAATKFKRGVFGHNIDLKNALENSGTYGERARLRMVLQQGATDAARFEMGRINDRVFKDLSPQEIKSLDELLRDRRVVEIASYKPDYTNPEGLGRGAEAGQKAEMHARQMARNLGPKMFDKINDRATAVLTEYRKLLVDGLESGILSRESFDRLLHFEYTPTQYVGLLDPVVTYNIHGKSISVRGSGIQDLGHGKIRAVHMDAQSMLAEAIGRIRNRQFKNRTLQALWDMADATPDNGIVSIVGKGEKQGLPGKHPPSGWTKLGLRIKGEQRELLMKDDFAEQFVASPQGIEHWVGNVARIASLSGPLRMSAVGYNPLFPLAGIPMDIAHIWAAKGREYSTVPPLYFAQIGKDMLEVLPDLVGKKGVYEQAMKEGLGAHYMAAYGREVFTRDKTLGEKLTPGHDKIRRVLQGANPEADIWVRLAHRNRLIKMGLSPEDATARVRDRLDYSESGILSRAVDTVWPWTSIAMEALYKVGRAAQRDPKDFAAKLAWVFGSYTAWNMANMLNSPETWKGISTSDKVRGLAITYGDQLYVLDEDGNRRYFYTPIRFDQVFTPIQATVVGALELAEYGRLPNDLVRQTMQQTFNVWNPMDGVPIVGAAAAMMNFNPYTGKPIFRGTVQPAEETEPGTHPAFTILGKAVDQSPMRMEAAAGKAISPYNPYVAAAGYGLRQLLGDTDYRTKAQTSEYMLASHLRPIIKLTNPMSAYADTIQDVVEKEGSRRKQQTDVIDKMIFEAKHKQGSMKDVSNWLNTQPPEDRERLYNRAKVGYTVDKIMDRYEAGAAIGVPPKAWWKITGAAPEQARAQEFHSKWLSADADGRKSMERIAETLHRNGAGYMTDGFKRELMRERSRLGTDRR